MNTKKNVTTSARVLMLCCIVAASLAANAKAPQVTTVAGGYVGDGKPATSASLATPISMAVDAKGNLYVSDSVHCRIRKINPKSVIATFAGTGICGFSGDGGPARSAMMSASYGITFDGKGNLLATELENNRVRKIAPNGTITTIAGNGTFAYSGDGGLATLASFSGPEGISVDSTGNIYIADSENYVIRMIDTAGIIQTVAGNHTPGYSGDGGPATAAGFNFPESVLVDGSGGFYIADTERVRRVDSAGTITTYAGNGSSGNSGNGGPATSASIGGTNGLLLAAGNLYVSTISNVWAVDLATQNIQMIAGSSTGVSGFNGDGNAALSTEFSSAWGMAFDSGGDLLVVDAYNNRVRRVDSSQPVTTVAGGYIGDGGRATLASLSLSGAPDGHIAFDPAGNLYIADSNDHRVRKVSPSGVITTIAGTGVSGYSGDGGPATSATLNFPKAVAADANGNVFILDGNNEVIRKVDGSGIITTFSNVRPFDGALATDASGNLYVADGLSAVWKVTPSGSATMVAGVAGQYGYNGDGIPATQAWLDFPNGLAIDSAGELYISEWLDQRVRKVDTSGIISTFAGNGTSGYNGDGIPATTATLNFPLDVAVDAKGNLYIGDWLNSRVRIVDPSGKIQTFVGTGNYGYNGNGLPATGTNVFPIALAVSPKDEVYVSDEGSFRVRKVH